MLWSLIYDTGLTECTHMARNHTLT